MAFYEAYKENGFTAAANKLGITQSALSHRIRNLEYNLQVTLFDRSRTGLRLTEAGGKLLQFCQNQLELEHEFLQSFEQDAAKSLVGTIRIGSTSSLAWSIVTPAIASLLKVEQKVQLDVVAKEVDELSLLFKHGRFDFLVTTEKINTSGLVEHQLGSERYVLIESTAHSSVPERILDHHEEDRFSDVFFGIQKRDFMTKYNRSFLDDNLGILTGVELGIGRAVFPLHLVPKNKKIRIWNKMRTLECPIYLYYRDKAFYSKLHKEVVVALLADIPKLLP